MPRRGLSPDVALNVQLSAICTRNQYTNDPAPVIVELRAAAGDRVDILAQVAGTFAGFYDGQYTHVLCAALLDEIEGASEWAEIGRQRAGARAHGAGGVHAARSVTTRAPDPPS